MKKRGRAEGFLFSIDSGPWFKGRLVLLLSSSRKLHALLLLLLILLHLLTPTHYSQLPIQCLGFWLSPLQWLGGRAKVFLESSWCYVMDTLIDCACVWVCACCCNCFSRLTVVIMLLSSWLVTC